MNDIRWGKYIFVLILTLGVVAVAILTSNYLYRERLAEVESVESRIQLNLLASEVQFELLKQLPCTEESLPVLSEELNTLAGRISFLEAERGDDDDEVRQLKRRYSLFQIKDFLAVRDIAARCKIASHPVLYFYSNEGDCADCKKQGAVLTTLRKEYPELRVYSFDYNLEGAGVDSLRRLYKLEGPLPVTVADNKPYYGFTSIEGFSEIFPDLIKLEPEATSTATSTATTTKE